MPEGVTQIRCDVAIEYKIKVLAFKATIAFQGFAVDIVPLIVGTRLKREVHERAVLRIARQCAKG